MAAARKWSRMGRNDNLYSARDKFPCKDCSERALGCHDRCERYASAKAKAEARKAVERERRQIIGAANEYTIKQAAMARRKKLPQR